MSPWTAPEVQRDEPRRQTGERQALEQWLDYHRATLLTKCAGLTAEQLKERAVPPSSLSLLGLVRHMIEVERWWFRVHVAGEEVGMPYWTREDPDGDFNGVADADAEADLLGYHQELERARGAVRDTGLDDIVRKRGGDPREDPNVRWIYLHMIEEYARHNGHADLLRERIDGATGD